MLPIHLQTYQGDPELFPNHFFHCFQFVELSLRKDHFLHQMTVTFLHVIKGVHRSGIWLTSMPCAPWQDYMRSHEQIPHPKVEQINARPHFNPVPTSIFSFDNFGNDGVRVMSSMPLPVRIVGSDMRQWCGSADVILMVHTCVCLYQGRIEWE